MDDLIVEPFRRLLAGTCDPAKVREIEAGGPASQLWLALDEAGFTDVLVSEERGGAGMPLQDAAPLIEACGRHALPVPLAYTMAVRAALAETGEGATLDGAATVAPKPPVTEDGLLRCSGVPFGAVADWVVVTHDGDCSLWPAAAATVERDGVPGSVAASLGWAAMPVGRIPLRAIDWPATAAGLTALLMAGGMERVLEMTIAQANERKQFGRAIGKFQAVQQQVSVLAERTFAVRMAARIACPMHGWAATRTAVGAAKSYANEAAVEVASIAHAVFGAIGITAEHDLNLYTRRLHAHRQDYGTETWWHRELGREWLATDLSALDFIRDRLAPTSA